MKRKRKWMIALGFLILVCGGYMAVSAGNEAAVSNYISTGIIDIELEEHQIKNGKEAKWQDNPLLLPGADVSKIPRIHNRGSDCYVRASIGFRDLAVDLERHIYGLGGSWVKKSDGYYYYTDILKTGESTDLFKGIQIPANFPQEAEGSAFHLDISVDAIQSQNFTPDFSSGMPWGQVEILKCEKQGPYQITSYTPGTGRIFQVEYRGESDSLFINEEDFFENFPVLMPGDVYSDSAELRNNSEKEMELYFRSEVSEKQELTEEVELFITVETDGNEKMLYKGPLKAESLSENRLLAKIPKSGQGKLSFTVTVPKELDNRYSAEEGQVKWIFTTNPKDSGLPSVRTGDFQRIGIFLAAAGVSLGLIVIIMKRKKSNETNHRYSH